MMGKFTEKVLRDLRKMTLPKEALGLKFGSWKELEEAYIKLDEEKKAVREVRKLAVPKSTLDRKMDSWRELSKALVTAAVEWKDPIPPSDTIAMGAMTGKVDKVSPLPSASAFTIKDSGRRTEFSSGMVRDIADDKIDYELVFNGPMLKRWAEHLTKGNAKYPDPEPGKANWMRAAGVEEAVRFRKSAVRHFVQWLMGATDEDHASALLFNVNGYEFVKEKMLCKNQQP